jgi:uncharacterized repeat protein (TIGR01451 family)
MKRGLDESAGYEPWPRAWRIAVVALCTLILCSCRAPRPDSVSGAPCPALPQDAAAGIPPWQAQMAQGENTFAGPDATPVPSGPVGPWAPPGIRQPWPEDEYLRDGGDHGVPAGVTPDWQVRGLETEDTVAHFDTLDGRTMVEPSNRVHIYSPRFGSVRQVVGIAQNEGREGWADVHLPVKLTRFDEAQATAGSKQHLQAKNDVGTKLASTFRGRAYDGAMSTAVGPKSFQDAFLTYENFQVIRTGEYSQAEMPFLAQAADAAVAWTKNQAVQVILERQGAMAAVGAQKTETVYTINPPPGDPRLRVIKVASTQFAEPGDILDFTIRFDNIGNQPIGNVTIIDNLTTRLEFVPQSAQCNLKGAFSTQPNEGESLALRWEIADPLPPGKGGIIRFRCRVR